MQPDPTSKETVTLSHSEQQICMKLHIYPKNRHILTQFMNMKTLYISELNSLFSEHQVSHRANVKVTFPVRD